MYIIESWGGGDHPIVGVKWIRDGDYLELPIAAIDSNLLNRRGQNHNHQVFVLNWSYFLEPYLSKLTSVLL